MEHEFGRRLHVILCHLPEVMKAKTKSLKRQKRHLMMSSMILRLISKMSTVD